MNELPYCTFSGSALKPVWLRGVRNLDDWVREVRMYIEVSEEACLLIVMSYYGILMDYK